MTRPRSPASIRARIGSLVLVIVALFSTAHRVSAIPPCLGDVVPADSVLVIFNAGPAAERPDSDLRATFDVAANLLARVSGVGLLSRVDSDTRAWIEVLASLPIVFKHPHALALLDISAAPLSDGGHKLAGLRAALIIDAGGTDVAIDQRIQHFLNTFTNNDDAALSRDERPNGTIYSLRDCRLPSWAVIQWGRFQDLYVVTIGAGAMSEVLRTIEERTGSMNSDPWFSQAFARVDGEAAAAGCYVGLNALYHDGDRQLAAKIDGVRAALNLDRTERALWTLRYRQRAVEINGFLKRDGLDVLQPIASSGFPAGVSHNVVPEQATGYTVVAGEPRRLFRGLCDAYLATRSDNNQTKCRLFWGGIERQAQVVLDRDIFPHLAAPIVIHNHPKHMLRLPFSWTVLTRVDGDAEALRIHVDKLLEATAAAYFATVVPNLRRHPDGVWSIDLGISGPALAVTDDWLILSFSPHAVRENLALLEALRSPPAEQGAKTVLRQSVR